MIHLTPRAGHLNCPEIFHQATHWSLVESAKAPPTLTSAIFLQTKTCKNHVFLFFGCCIRSIRSIPFQTSMKKSQPNKSSNLFCLTNTSGPRQFNGHPLGCPDGHRLFDEFRCGGLAEEGIAGLGLDERSVTRRKGGERSGRLFMDIYGRLICNYVEFR